MGRRRVGTTARPAPTSWADCGSGTAVRTSSCQSARLRRPVLRASVAATPATCGVAMLVPLLNPYEPFATGTDEYVATPGAAMLISPPLPLSATHENGARSSAWSRAATASTDGLLAGAPTGAHPSFPA